MDDVIYLRCDRVKVLGMTKSMPSTTRGQIVIKTKVHIDAGAYGPPTIEQEIIVKDWADVIGHDAALVDLALERPFITPAEAERIKADRLAEMARLVAASGKFEVTPIDPEEDPDV